MFLQSEVTLAIQKELGSFFSTEAHTPADIVRYMNSAGNYIASFRDFPFLIKDQIITYTTPGVVATIEYNVKTLGINGDKNAIIIGKEDWFYPENRDGAYMIEGDEFIANSSGTYTILYISNPPKLTLDTLYIDMPEQFQQVYTDIAIHYGFKDIKNYEKAGAKIGAANAELTLLAQRITNQKPRTNPRLGSRHKI